MTPDHPLAPPHPTQEETEQFYVSALEVLVDGVEARRDSRRKLIRRVDRYASGAWWVAALVAIGWAMGRMIDDSPPYDAVSVTTSFPIVQPGQVLDVTIDVNYTRVCEGTRTWSIRDSRGEVRTFGPEATYTPATLGPLRIQRSIWIPIDLAPGPAVYMGTATYTNCKGSFLSNPWHDVTAVGPPLEFVIGAAQKPPTGS